jgi:hypothetical protein
VLITSCEVSASKMKNFVLNKSFIGIKFNCE